MSKTITSQHPKEIILFTVSRFFERVAFYGIRAFLVIYMIESSLAMRQEKAFQLYGWFVSSFIFSNIIGALLGDLIIGNKWASIVGGALQAIGAFILSVPNEASLYLGLLLIVIGNGLYTPNLISSIGKLYQEKEDLLDSAFTLLYTIINVGAFIGAYFITTIAHQHFYIGFITAGILMILSLIPIILYKQPVKQVEETHSKVYSDKNILIVIASVLLSGFFWIVYDISSGAMFQLQMNTGKDSSREMPMIMNAMGPMFAVFFGIVLSIVWAFIKYPRNIKLLIGFILATLSGVVLLFVNTGSDLSLILLCAVSVLLFSLAELHIAPILTALTIKNSNPKYFALIFSASVLPYGIYSLLKHILFNSLEPSFTVSLFIGIISFAIISVALLAITLVQKENTNK